MVRDKTELGLRHATSKGPRKGTFGFIESRLFLWYGWPVKKADLYFNVARLPVDFLMLLAAGVTTYLLRTRILSAFRPVLFQFDLPLGRYLSLVVAMSFLFIAAFAISGLYSLKTRRNLAQEFSRIAIASSAGIMVVIIMVFLRQALFNSRFLVLGAWFFAIIFVFLGRVLVRRFQMYAVLRHDFGIHKVLLIGNDQVTERIASEIAMSPSFGYRIIRQLSDPALADVRQAAGNPGVDEVILANPNYPADRIVELVDFCHEQHIIFKFVPNIYQTLTTHFDVDVIGEVPLIELKRTALDGWGRVFKRCFDIVGSSLALIALSPLFAVVAFAIKWETYGPVFVRLKRVSGNREFGLLKFRSMIAIDTDGLAHSLNAYYRSVRNDRPEAGPLWKMKDDPRITRVGKFIRKYRIDEFPQFWNVLKGDISIVGPRPHQPDEIAKYQKHHKKVLAIKAGATGLAQVSGSSDLPFEEEVALDSLYIENWTLWMDLKILFTTFLKVLRDRSAV